MADDGIGGYVPPPHDLDAERAVLGTMILDNAVIPQVIARMKGGDFYHPAHAEIFEGIVDLDAAREAVDVTTLAAALRQRQRLNTVGGAQYIGELTDAIVTTAHVESHVTILTNLSAARKALEDAQALICKIRGGMVDPQQIAECLGKTALAMNRAEAVRAMVPVLDVLASLFDHVGEEPPGAVHWPWVELSRKFGPLLPKECVIVSAEPATGKSALVLLMAVHAARCGQRVLFFSLEMDKNEIGRRMLAQASGIPEAKMLGRAPMEPGEREHMIAVAQELGRLPMSLSDDPSITLLRLRAEVQHAKATKGCDLVVVDYLQLIARDEGEDEKNETTRLENLSRGLKKLAMEFEVVLIVVSSLNDTRGQKGAPVMANLRGSRSIGFDANKIFMLYTEEEIDEENPPLSMEVKIKARKNRGGQRNATAALRFEGPLYRFTLPEGDDCFEGPARSFSAPSRSAQSARREVYVPPTPVTSADDPSDSVYARAGEGLPNEEVVFPGERSGPLFMADGTTDPDDPFD